MLNNEGSYERFISVTEDLTAGEKKYIHFKSFQNFFLHLHIIASGQQKDKIISLLQDYLTLVVQNRTSIDRVFANKLATEYLFILGDLFRSETGFVEIMRFPYAVLITLILDTILIFFGFATFFGIPVPVSSIIISLYYLFCLRKFVQSKRVFGMYY